MSSGLRGRIHRHSHLLLHLGELETLSGLWGHVCHGCLALNGRVARKPLQWLLNHAHVDILLMCGSDLLLLLLEQLDLLLKSQLFHHEGRELRWAPTVSNMKPAAGRAWDSGLPGLSHADNLAISNS
jgi:hypothetical protein